MENNRVWPTTLESAETALQIISVGSALYLSAAELNETRVAAWLAMTAAEAALKALQKVKEKVLVLDREQRKEEARKVMDSAWVKPAEPTDEPQPPQTKLERQTAKRADAKKERIKRHRTIVADYLALHTCAKCGATKNLLFCPKDPKAKRTSVGRLVAQGYSMDRVREQIDRCVVLCKSCWARIPRK